MQSIRRVFIIGLFSLISTLALATRPDVPEKPINLSVKGEFKGAVATARLKWQDQSDNELGFEILRSDNGAEYRVVGFAGANTEAYEDKVGKYINGAFAYQVRAFNEEGKSETSNAASVWF